MQVERNPSIPKGRSKLSSRHNRRKRRERENKGRPAKRQHTGRIPIPSFTPILEEHHDGCTTRGEVVEGASEALKSSFSAGPVSGGSDTTKPTAAFGGVATRDNSTIQSHERFQNDDPFSEALSGPSSSPAYSSSEQTCVNEQKVVRAKDKSGSTSIQQIETYPAASSGNAMNEERKHLQYTTNQKNLSVFPSRMSPETSAPSTSETPPENRDQPPFQIDCRKSPSSQAVRAGENIGMISQQRHGTKERKNPRTENLVLACHHIKENSSNHPANEKSNIDYGTSVRDLLKVSELDWEAKALLNTLSSTKTSKIHMLTKSSSLPLVQPFQHSKVPYEPNSSPAHWSSKQTGVHEQKEVYAKDESGATDIQELEIPQAAFNDNSTNEAREDSQHSAKPPQNSVFPTRMSPEIFAQSKLEALPKFGQPPAQIYCRKSSPGEGVPVGQSIDMSREERNLTKVEDDAGEEIFVLACSDTTEDTSNHPPNEKSNKNDGTPGRDLPKASKPKREVKALLDLSPTKTSKIHLLTKSNSLPLVQPVQQPAPGRDTPNTTESDMEIDGHHNSSRCKKSKCFSNVKELSRTPLYRQTRNVQQSCNDSDHGNSIGHTKATKTNRPKYLGTAKCGPPEVIEIIDEELDTNDMAVPQAKSERSSKKSTGNKKNDTKKSKTNKSKQKCNKHKTPISISRSSSDSSSEDEFVHNKKRIKKNNDRKSQTGSRNQTAVKIKDKPPKRSKALARTNLCFACSSCKCNSRAGADVTPRKVSSLSGSDARQEQSLLNRLQRLERDIAWKEGQRNDVARDLKKHRGKMVKKWQAPNTSAQRPQFLADVEVSDNLGCSYSRINSKEINRAQKQIFGRRKSHQPTLTQIVCGSKDENVPEVEKSSKMKIDCKSEVNSKHSCAKVAPENASDFGGRNLANSPGGHQHLLSFWTKPAPIEDSTRCFGSMKGFHYAVAKSKELKKIGKWAQATANALGTDGEEGFDALVELFNRSMERSKSDGVTGISQNPIEDNDDGSPTYSLLTPSGKKVADEIISSVGNDSKKMAAIERMCPNWKENVEFAQAQTDQNDIVIALRNVQQAKTDLVNMKERVLQAFIDRQQTLDFYEKMLQAANARLSDKEDGKDNTN